MFFILLIFEIKTQNIFNGLEFIEKSFDYKLEYNVILQRNCQSKLQLYCNLLPKDIPASDLSLIDDLYYQSQELIDILEDDEQYNQYYSSTINQLIQDYALYEEQEQYLSVLLDFTNFQPTSNTSNKTQIYYLDIKKREIYWDQKQFKIEEVNDSDIVTITIENFNSLQQKVQFVKKNLFHNYPPDGFFIETKQDEGIISFNKPVYIAQFHVYATQPNLNIQFFSTQGLIKILTVNQKEWTLIRGPEDKEISKIIIDNGFYLDSLFIKLPKIKFSNQQLQSIILQRLLSKYKQIHKEQLLDKIDVNEQKEKVIVLPEELDLNIIELLLKFIEKIRISIQNSKKNESDTISSDEILIIIEKVGNEMQQNEKKIFQTTLKTFFDSEYNEHDIENLYQVLLYVKQAVLEITEGDGDEI